jgi:hypothetical protein
MAFSVSSFVDKLGARLISEFEDASQAGTPGLVGSAREHPARKQLEKVLPGFTGLGSGIVMDVYGSHSTQQDIVMYERDFCPVYSINDTPEATFYPIEGVIAVGEVKSTVDKGTLIDALNKLKSAKALLRQATKTSTLGMPPASDYRHYGSRNAYGAVTEDEYDQSIKSSDQIFSFLLCNKFSNSAKSVIDNVVDYGKLHGKQFLPNIIISLNDGFTRCISKSDNSLKTSPMDADGIVFCNQHEKGLLTLVTLLRVQAESGRTVPIDTFLKYMSRQDNTIPISLFQHFE